MHKHQIFVVFLPSPNGPPLYKGGCSKPAVKLQTAPLMPRSISWGSRKTARITSCLEWFKSCHQSARPACDAWAQPPFQPVKHTVPACALSVPHSVQPAFSRLDLNICNGGRNFEDHHPPLYQTKIIAKQNLTYTLKNKTPEWSNVHFPPKLCELLLELKI